MADGAKEKRKLLLLTGNDQYLTTKLDGTAHTHILSQVDVDKIEALLRESFSVERQTFGNLDLNRNYKDYCVVYGSTEERGLFYKNYIEDVLYRLFLDGAILVPRMEYARAYGNKGFQEILRKRFSAGTINHLKSEVIGRYSDFDVNRYKNYPYVVKASSGSGSKGVMLAHNAAELDKIVKHLSKSVYYDYSFTPLKDIGYMELPRKFKIWLYKKLKKSQRLEDPKKWFHANKVVIQEYINGLDSDYKVLYYYGKYYVLNRKNRDNDFRASGSGKFLFPGSVNEIEDILGFAERCVNEMDVPMVSLDIGMKGQKGYLIEFQCLGFGPYTQQFSNWHFERDKNDHWIRAEGNDGLEEEIARSIKEYILS